MSRLLILVLIVHVTVTAELINNLNIKVEDRNMRRAVLGNIQPENVKDDNQAKESANNVNSESGDEHKTFQLVSVNLNDKNSSSIRSSNNTIKALESNNASKSDTNQTEFRNDVIVPNKKSTIDSDALLRGFYVFLGLSALTLVYVMYRSCRIQKGNNRPTTVRKYGVLTQRTDMEMLPLPLDDDEDDDTVFDVGTHTNR